MIVRVLAAVLVAVLVVLSSLVVVVVAVDGLRSQVHAVTVAVSVAMTVTVPVAVPLAASASKPGQQVEAEPDDEQTGGQGQPGIDPGRHEGALSETSRPRMRTDPVCAMVTALPTAKAERRELSPRWER